MFLFLKSFFVLENGKQEEEQGLFKPGNPITNSNSHVAYLVQYLDSLTPSSLILNGIYAYIPSFRHHLHVVIGDGLQYRHLECRDLRYFHVDTWMHVAVTWAQEKQQLIVYQDTKVNAWQRIIHHRFTTHHIN